MVIYWDMCRILLINADAGKTASCTFSRRRETMAMTIRRALGLPADWQMGKALCIGLDCWYHRGTIQHDTCTTCGYDSDVQPPTAVLFLEGVESSGLHRWGGDELVMKARNHSAARLLSTLCFSYLHPG